ncbi:folylpolyglutamate synthase/dihydrofolate synthase family protein [Urechidicola sp. KH5]
MTYQETLDWMFSQLPMYQNQGKTAFKKDLDNTIALAEHLGNPHNSYPTIHVAGTNGKGSTSHMIASVLQEAGLKVGLYTSPHLKDFRERIKINGQPISEVEVVDFIEYNHDFFENHKLSFFEMTVGLAFESFKKYQVDIAVIEVGLGGRLDSTNIITPLVSVITNIGLDHVQMLGDTLPLIAAEKAGIIKPKIPVVVGEFQEEIHYVFYNKALENRSSLFLAELNIKEDYSTDLLGSYQLKNCKTAVQVLTVLKDKYPELTEEVVRKGLQNIVHNTGLLGRWQVLNEEPLTVCDTAHNKEGLSFVLEQVKNQSYQKLHIVLGVVNDKSLEDILPMFPEDATYYFCKPNIPRGLDVTELKDVAQQYGLNGKDFNSVDDAFKEAKSVATKTDMIYVGGSTFVVAEVV